MAAQKNEKAGSPLASTTSSREARTKARKDAHRAANEAQRLRNIELRRQGQPTPHEEKRMARAAKRAPKQAEFKRLQAAKEKLRLDQEARAKLAQEKLATTLIREHQSHTTKAGVAKLKRKPAPVTVSSLEK